MIPPALAARNFLSALVIGGILGLVYGFLRPLRPRLTCLADGIFVLAAFLGWVYLAFGICAGDIRPGYTVGLFIGGWAEKMTLGRLLRPVFALFWRIIFWPVKKIFDFFRKIYKFLLAILKKWVTMVGTITKEGGATHGKKRVGKAGHEAKQSRHKGRHSGRSGSVAGGTGGTI